MLRDVWKLKGAGDFFDNYIYAYIRKGGLFLYNFEKRHKKIKKKRRLVFGQLVVAKSIMKVAKKRGKS